MGGVDLIFKVAAIGILVAVLNQLLVRSGREDQAMLTTGENIDILFAGPVFRQHDFHGGIGGRGNFPNHFIRSFELPVRGDFAVGSFLFGPGKCQPRIRVTGKGDLFSSGRSKADAANRIKDPLVDGTVSVVVETVHIDIAEAVFYGVRVPPFPDGGGSLID